MTKRLPLILSLAAAVLGAGGCATPSMQRSTAPLCTEGPDCEAKWDAAQLWIAQHAGFPLTTVSPTLLQTDGPNRAIGVGRIAVTVTREPAGRGRFLIVASIGCGNYLGCEPEVEPSLADFNRTVGAATAP